MNASVSVWHRALGEQRLEELPDQQLELALGVQRRRREDNPRTPATVAAIEAYDAAGRNLLMASASAPHGAATGS